VETLQCVVFFDEIRRTLERLREHVKEILRTIDHRKLNAEMGITAGILEG
jgi:hypothetical protein